MIFVQHDGHHGYTRAWNEIELVVRNAAWMLIKTQSEIGFAGR